MDSAENGTGRTGKQVSWLYVIVDGLASAYGWSKTEILETVYLDEAWEYIKLTKRRKINEMRLLSSIYHGDPQELNTALEEQLEEMDKAIVEPEEPELDKAGFEALKSVMRNNPRMQIK